MFIIKGGTVIKRIINVAAALILAVSSFFIFAPQNVSAANEDHRILYVSSADNNGPHVVTINPDGTDRRSYGGGLEARFSPDEQKIAFFRSDATDWDVFVVNVDGTNEINLTANSSLFYGGQLSWSPDSSTIAVGEGTLQTKWDIVTIPADGNGPITNITNTPNIYEFSPLWSPNGAKMAFRSDEVNGESLFTMDANGSNKHFVTTISTFYSWSPDSQKLTFSTPSSRIAVANADGSQLIYVSGLNATMPQWSPDGTKIAYKGRCPTNCPPGSGNTINTVNPDGTNDFQVTAHPVGGDVDQPSWSPDGSTILFTRYDPNDPPLNYHLASVAATGGPQQTIFADQGGVSWPMWGAFRFVDNSGPVLGDFVWSANPKAVAATSSLNVSATDDGGVVGGEYFIGDTDPGQGNGATIAFNGTDLTATFGNDFPTGVYKISVRAQDAAGNWSTVASDYLVVYSPDVSKITGKRVIVPTLANGDVLPGLINTTQTDKATFGFSVHYNDQGQVHPNSDLQLSYKTGTSCNKPAQAVNCHDLSLNSTQIDWFATQGTNNSTGRFQGSATLTVDGQVGTVIFRVTGVDGNRLTPVVSDEFEIRIFNQGANPDADAPTYIINRAAIDQGSIKIQ